MKVCSKCNQEKPYEAFPKRKESVDGYRGTCRECNNARSRKWHKDNPEWRKERQRGYHETYKENNHEKLLEGYREYSRNNRKKKTDNFRKWRHNNPEKAGATIKRHQKARRQWAEENVDRVRASQKRWRNRNAGKVSAAAASRREREAQATPPWLTKEHKLAIAEIYRIARTKKEFHEIEFHVDHIEPIKGVNENREHVSCGLHVPWNLQVLTDKENYKKSNKLNLN